MRQPYPQQDKLVMSHKTVIKHARHVAHYITDHFHGDTIHLYGVPRGGVTAAYLVMSQLFLVAPHKRVMIVNSPEDADFIIDDLVDTGHTMRFYQENYSAKFCALTKKQDKFWYVFPWEDTNYPHPQPQQED